MFVSKISLYNMWKWPLVGNEFGRYWLPSFDLSFGFIGGKADCTMLTVWLSISKILSTLISKMYYLNIKC